MPCTWRLAALHHTIMELMHSDIATVKRLIKILNVHYPDRLGMAIIFNAPWFVPVRMRAHSTLFRKHSTLPPAQDFWSCVGGYNTILGGSYPSKGPLHQSPKRRPCTQRVGRSYRPQCP